MFGLPKVAWQSIVAAVVLLGGFWVVSCYGKSRYEEGVKRANINATDVNRRAMTRALDSANKAMEPVLTGLLRERDSLSQELDFTRARASEAVRRARNVEHILANLPDSVVAATPPEVVAVLDSLRVSNNDLIDINTTLTKELDRTRASEGKALAAAADWRRQYQSARLALDTAGREIAAYKRLKDPPRCGFKCGLVTGTIATIALLGSVFAAIH